jgi:carboxyl-terminal processing protease
MKPVHIVLFGIVTLLSACSSGNSGGNTTPVVSDSIPAVARGSRPSAPVCDVTTSSSLVDWRTSTGQDLVKPNSTFKKREGSEAFVPDTLFSVLYATKSILNTYYYGFSTVDLNATHKTYEDSFRASKGNLINTMLKKVDDPSIDAPMNKYLDSFKDLHTFFLNPSNYGGRQAVSSGAAQPTASLGFKQYVIFNDSGIMLLDVEGEGPLFKAGFRRGDKIISIDGVALTAKASFNATAQAYGQLIFDAGKKATPVAIQYVRKGQTATVTTNLTGAVLPAGELPWGEVIPGRPGSSLFYIRVPHFLVYGGEAATGTGEAVHALVAQAKATNAKGIVLDLRDNPGGLLVEGMAVVGALAPSKALQKVEFLDGSDVTFRYDAAQVKVSDNCGGTDAITVTGPSEWTGKIAILESEGSASASEVTAQLLKQSGRASVIGEETLGIGNTTTYTFPVSSGRAISVTAGRSRDSAGSYLTASVVPDVAAADDFTELSKGNDLALEAAKLNLP